MNVVLIYNSASGRQYDLRTLKRLFKKYDVTVTDSFTVRQLQSKKLASLLKKGVTLAVVGGDGTLNSAAQMVVDTKSVLLALPGGTFNHFVRDLGMAGDVEGILQGIHKAKTKMIDVAYVNDQLFLNNSNIGMYPFSLLERKQVKRIAGKWIAAAIAAIDQLVKFHRHTLTIDGETFKTPFVFVGNNTYDLSNFGLPMKKTLRGGKLFVVISTARSRLTLINIAVMAVMGKVREHDDVEVREVKQLEIGSRRTHMTVSYDGEAAKMASPLHYACRSKSLRVMYVPKSDV